MSHPVVFASKDLRTTREGASVWSIVPFHVFPGNYQSCHIEMVSTILEFARAPCKIVADIALHSTPDCSFGVTLASVI